MRFVVLLVATSLTACASAPKIATYSEPNEGQQQAWVIREACPGFGRGLIYYSGVDGRNFTRSEYQHLKLAPGRHTIKVEMVAPGASWDVEGAGFTDIAYDFSEGSYIVKYLRTGIKTYKAWIEPLDLSGVDLSKPLCTHPPFADQRYWQ